MASVASGISGSNSPNAGEWSGVAAASLEPDDVDQGQQRADREQRELGSDRVPVDDRPFPPIGRDDLLGENQEVHRFARRHDLASELIEADLAGVGVEGETVRCLRP